MIEFDEKLETGYFDLISLMKLKGYGSIKAFFEDYRVFANVIVPKGGGSEENAGKKQLFYNAKIKHTYLIVNQLPR